MPAAVVTLPHRWSEAVPSPALGPDEGVEWTLGERREMDGEHIEKNVFISLSESRGIERQYSSDWVCILSL